MPEIFTIAEQAIIDKASQDLYRYERICAEHSAILRRDLGALTKAQREYKANSKPMGALPCRNEFDSYIEDSEKVLKKDCRTVLEFEAAYKFDRVIANLLFFVATFMWYTLRTLSAGS
jgi:hypothetical protein